MSEPDQLDRIFQIIMRRMMETGQAPHYTEIAAEMDVPVEEGRRALHELFSTNFFTRRLDPDYASRNTKLQSIWPLDTWFTHLKFLWGHIMYLNLVSRMHVHHPRRDCSP